MSTVDDKYLAARFDAEHERLRGVARRVLGDCGEEEVDEALAKARQRLVAPCSDAVPALDSAGGWLTAVVGRICLDALRTRDTKRTEDPAAPVTSGASGTSASSVRSTASTALTGSTGSTPLTASATPPASPAEFPPVDLIGTVADPGEQALLADAIGRALVGALEALGPAERLAFVLHDVFALPFDDVAADTGTTAASARELAGRARRNLRSTAPDPTAPDPDGPVRDGDGSPSRHRALIAAFQAAARRADVPALQKLLDPDAVLRADLATLESGGLGVVRGARAVAEACALRVAASRPATVDGAEVLVWSPDGRPRAVYRFTFAGDRITAIDLHADPEHLAAVLAVPPPP
ncbi:sigma factor-like helix-turn-helix DNA-binding protein [Yinghuangia soli]|uniref:sigma factor-like helix-turn-helix DNA-binding protein n=1 Tax=Yinghuangia soli TaxID=2908204 RepID=UPI00254640A6|nr:sigma factor-like helix-turn-helix DNA-binding protein [Yinghuangia soli]